MARNFDDYEANPFAAPESDLTPERYRSKGDTPTYGSFLERFGAMILDGIILQVFFVIVVFGIGMAMGPAFLESREFLIPYYIVAITAQWLYFALQESSEARATLGKKAVGLRVTTLDDDQITFGQATGRYFAKLLSGLLLLIGYLMQPFTERKQALHDMLAGTLVVKK